MPMERLHEQWRYPEYRELMQYLAIANGASNMEVGAGIAARVVYLALDDPGRDTAITWIRSHCTTQCMLATFSELKKISGMRFPELLRGPLLEQP